MLELLAAVEAQFEISIPDEEVPRISSFGSLVDFNRKALKDEVRLGMKERRVVVTGTGLITPFGIGSEKFWHAIRSGRSAITRIRNFDPSQMKCQIAGACDDFDPTFFLDPDDFRRMDRVSQFAVAGSFSCHRKQIT